MSQTWRPSQHLPPQHSPEHMDRMRAAREAARQAQRRDCDMLSSREVCELLGLTYRQLHYWVEHGWIPGLDGPGSGRSLRWRSEHVEHARQIKDTIDHLVALTGPGFLRGHGVG